MTASLALLDTWPDTQTMSKGQHHHHLLRPSSLLSSLPHLHHQHHIIIIIGSSNSSSSNSGGGGGGSGSGCSGSCSSSGDSSITTIPITFISMNTFSIISTRINDIILDSIIAIVITESVLFCENGREAAIPADGTLTTNS